MYKRVQLRKIRSKLNDFQRFKVRVLKRQVSVKVTLFYDQYSLYLFNFLQRNRTVNGGVVQLKKAMNKQ